ncbi:MAG: DUF3696 domain-containing protein [Chloroflexi bacterium]|nr:DUF3696 domain-containing protein [Chloroflexota bacterium]
MLRRMSLTNFKCWRKLDVELAPITLFFGTNSSGKTAILQSLLMLKQTVIRYDNNVHLNLGASRRDYLALGNYREMIFNHDERRELEMGLKWILDERGIEELKIARWVEADLLRDSPYPEYQIGYESIWRLNGAVYTKSVAYELIEDGQTLHLFKSRRRPDKQYKMTHYVMSDADSFYAPGLYDETISPGLEGGFLITGSSPFQLTNSDITIVARLVAFQLAVIMGRMQHIGPLRESPSRIYEWNDSDPFTIHPDGANAMQMLIAAAREESDLLPQVEHGLQSLGLVHKFSVEPIDKDKQIYKAAVKFFDSKSALSDVGFGVSQVLPVVTLLFSAPQGSIILLEQPELHLHPNAQAALADLMLHVAETRGLQLIVETHSEHLLRRFQRRIAENQSGFVTPDNIKMYFCQPGEDGSTATEIDISRFGQISNWPEKFLGDISGDLHEMVLAALERRSEEIQLG